MNESFARGYFGRLDVVGETIALIQNFKDPPRQIVGVIADVKGRSGSGWTRGLTALGSNVAPSMLSERLSVTVVAFSERRTIHVEDIRTAEAEYPDTASRSRAGGSEIRTMAGTPLLREGIPLGVLYINRGPEAQPFSAKQIALLETFANQAVIAIENVRLFNELRIRTEDLTRSVAQLTALGEVSRAVSATLDLDTVLDTIVTRANQLVGTGGCTIYEYDAAAEEFRLRASRYADPREAAILDPIGHATPIPKGQGLSGRAAMLREPVHIPDIAAAGAYESPVRAPRRVSRAFVPRVVPRRTTTGGIDSSSRNFNR